ncbi:hypothetical protein [Paenibacillus illinoisensis]|uniref:hypothetical protein n=1 Tax=Paenibacillus illinoisensis TaxID=59845 RepID=UPI003D97A647
MRTFKRLTLYLVLLLLMACSALLPLLFTKINDQRVLGQIHFQTLEDQGGGQSVSYSMIDKLHLLSEKRMRSPDIAVIQNAHLSEADMQKVGAECLAELQKLSEVKLLPELEDGLRNSGYEGASFTVYDATKPERAVTFYDITMLSNPYRISFTMDAETHKIYELIIVSDDGPLVIDEGNAYLHWQEYIGLTLVPSPSEAPVDDAVEHSEPDSMMATVPSSSQCPAGDASEREEQDSLVAPLVIHNYTDGTQSVSYSFTLAGDGKRFTIFLSSP